MALLVGLLSGCAAVSPGSRMGEAVEGVPGSWAATREGRAGVDGEWVARFGDPVLDRLVDEALVNNRDLRAAAARVDAAVAGVRIAGSGMRPTMDANFTGGRQEQNFIGFPVGGDPGSPEAGASGAAAVPQGNLFNSFGVSLDVAWELDVWGRVRAGQSATQAEAEAAGADLRAAEVSLVAQVAKAYFALVEAKEQVALARETKSNFEETAQALRDRFELGEDAEGGLGAELRLAMSDVASAEAQLHEAESLRNSAVRQLEVLAGRYPAGVAASAESLPRVPSRPPGGLPSELLQRRPDLLAAERRFAARGARVTEGERALFPQLRLTGSAGTNSGEIDDLLDSDFGVWNIAGSALQPILTGGRLRGEIDRREAEEREALAALQESVLQAFSEVEIALANDRALAAQEEALREASELAVEADSSARADYRDATGEFLTVLTAQRRVLQTRAELIRVHRLRLDNRVNLHLALGGDFRAHPAARPAAAGAEAKSDA